MSDNAMPVDALLAQGCCCGSECANCPYIENGQRHVAGTTNINQPWVEFKKNNPDKTYQDFQAQATA